MTEVKAEVPMSEMLTYSQALTSQTGGRGDYSMHFLRYEEVPTHVAQKIIDQMFTWENVIDIDDRVLDTGETPVNQRGTPNGTQPHDQ